MPLFNRRKKKKKSIPEKKILKALEDKEVVDLGKPFGEKARRYLVYKINKMIHEKKLQGTFITPQGIYMNITGTEVKDIIALIKAKGICNLNEIASENNWSPVIVKVIAKYRLNLYQREDKSVITHKTALNLVEREILQGEKVDLTELAKELLLSEEIILELIKQLQNDESINGIIKPEEKVFIPMSLLEDSIIDYLDDLVGKKVQEVEFTTIAEEFEITNDTVYNLLLKLRKEEDLNLQLNLGKRICILKDNVKIRKFEKKIPEEEKKLEIEDLTKK